MASLRAYKVEENPEKKEVLVILLENEKEVRREVFPATYYGDYTSDEQAMGFAKADAETCGLLWIGELQHRSSVPGAS